MSTGVILYHQARGKARGIVHLVEYDTTEDEYDDAEVRLICMSTRKGDKGVIFVVHLDLDDYEDICSDNDVKTLEDCIIAATASDFELIEVPNEAPPPRPIRAKKAGNLRVLINPRLYQHPWGRCCCVRRGDALEPVTRERIAAEDVPWWTDTYTPYERDLSSCADNYSGPVDDSVMHVLDSPDRICPSCKQPVWVYGEEDPPETLPPREGSTAPEPLIADRDALAVVGWSSRKDAWEVFIEDPHNAHIIEKSGLPVMRANESRRFSSESAFAVVNAHPNIKENVHTVRQAFYASLGTGRSGTWADFDLEVLRSVEGLQEVEVPASVLEEVDLGNVEANQSLRDKVGAYQSHAAVDDDAEMLEDLLDEEAMSDDDEEGAEEGAEELADEEAAAREVVQEPGTTSYGRAQKNEPRVPSNREKRLLEAAIELREKLSVFIHLLENDDGEE